MAVQSTLYISVVYKHCYISLRILLKFVCSKAVTSFSGNPLV